MSINSCNRDSKTDRIRVLWWLTGLWCVVIVLKLREAGGISKSCYVVFLYLVLWTSKWLRNVECMMIQLTFSICFFFYSSLVVVRYWESERPRPLAIEAILSNLMLFDRRLNRNYLLNLWDCIPFWILKPFLKPFLRCLTSRPSIPWFLKSSKL